MSRFDNNKTSDKKPTAKKKTTKKKENRYADIVDNGDYTLSTLNESSLPTKDKMEKMKSKLEKVKKMEKKSITVRYPMYLAEKIDATAKEMGVNRSKVLEYIVEEFYKEK